MPYLSGEETVVYWTPLFIIVIDDHVHIHVCLDGVCCEYIIAYTNGMGGARQRKGKSYHKLHQIEALL